MSCVSVAQPCSYQLLSEVVKQEDFWAKFENAAPELHRLIRVIGKDLHRRFERLVFLSWLLQCNRFPYKEETTNEWFGHNILGEPEREITTLNVSLNEEERGQWQRWQNIVKERAPLPDLPGTLFFHGTSHESALKILRERIDITKGGERLDFSDGEGFYVTDDFSESIQYAVLARSRGASHANLGAAVLIYFVDEEELNQNFCGLDFNDNLEEWRKVVKEYRQIERGRIDSELREQLEHYSFIQGPISSTSRDGELQPDSPPKRQLCIRNIDCAQFFDQKFHSVIFFEKPPQLVSH